MKLAPWLQRLRRLGLRFGALMTALVLLLAFVRGGSSYVYCPMMQAVRAASCCAHAAHPDDSASPIEGASVDSPDCCHGRRLGVVSPSPVPQLAQLVLGSPCVAVLPAGDLSRSERPAAEVMRFDHPVRAGPPTALERRAQLMVFHI